MDEVAKNLVHEQVCKQLTEESENPVCIADFEVYIVWKCKVLKNYKYLLCTSRHDDMYYELTFNGSNKEWYMDVYKKQKNICIPVVNEGAV